MTPFTERYLLVMGLPYYLDEAGRVWLDRLWHRDLILHLRYLPRLRLAAPRLVKRDEPDLVQLSDADARRLELVLVIESAFWRPTPGAPRSAARFLRYRLTQVLGRWSINRAQLVIATHRGYLHSLATHPRGITAVTPASWVAEADLLAGEAAARLWQRKLAEPARFAFFGRLIADKGVLVLLEALERLAAADKALRVDLVGQGELAP